VSGRLYRQGDGRLAIAISYDPKVVEQIRSVPGRKYDPDTRVWSAPFTSLSALRMLEIARAAAVTCEPASLAAEITALSAQAEQNQVDSRASSADFDVPGLGGTLRPFQRAGVKYATVNGRVFIADEPGLGKTVQALAVLEHTQAFPALVVVPATLKPQWRVMGRYWLPKRRIKTLDGFNLDADVLITNYEALSDGWQPDMKRKTAKLSEPVRRLKEMGIKALVLDECHYVKGRTSQRTSACRQLAKGVALRLLLSGTPIMNKTAELIPQLQILGRVDDLGGEWFFLHRYCGYSQGAWGGQTERGTHMDELNERLRAVCYIRRRKEDVLTELPAKQRSEVVLPITNRHEYERACADVVSWVGERAEKDREFNASIALFSAEDQKRMRAERSADASAKAERAEQLVRIEALKMLAARGKLAAAREWIETFMDGGQKLVVFASHIEIQRELLTIWPGAARIMGEDGPEVRQANVSKFQDDTGCRLIVCSLKAGGLGLTLTAASNVAFLELGWTPAEHDQAEDRVHRIGQTDQVTAWYLLAEDTIEQEINVLIREKREVVDASVDGAEPLLKTLLSRLGEKAA
jgi:SNF2 family DNA or RNA helicase